MKISICFFFILGITCAANPWPSTPLLFHSHNASGTTDLFAMRRADVYHYSTSNLLISMAYEDNMIDKIELILFGPEKVHSIMRLPSDHDLELTVDEAQCFESSPTLFRKYCGLPSQDHLRHMQSFENMCRFVLDKADIKDAIIAACGGMPNIDPDPYAIDVGNPIIDVTPAPIHGSSHFCERFSLPGISRLKIQSFFKAYRLELLPPVLVHEEDYNKIQICFHRNASLGLCECEDYESIQKQSWSSLMSPYEKSYVDVKFNDGVSGSVTVILHEVSQGFRCAFLLLGIGFLFVAPSLSKNVFHKRVEQYAKWTMHIFAVQLLFMSSIDTLLAMVALLFSLAFYYLIISINAPILLKKTKQWLWSKSNVRKDGDRDRGLTTRSQFYSTFHNIPDRKKYSQKDWEEFTKEMTGNSVGELASSPKFIDWVMKKRANTELPVPPPDERKLGWRLNPHNPTFEH